MKASLGGSYQDSVTYRAGQVRSVRGQTGIVATEEEEEEEEEEEFAQRVAKRETTD